MSGDFDRLVVAPKLLVRRGYGAEKGSPSAHLVLGPTGATAGPGWGRSINGLGIVDGAEKGIRTLNPRFTKAVLYH